EARPALGRRAAAGLPDAEAMAARARAGGRSARVRDLPQLDARGDRGARSADARRARARARRRPGEARALRRRRARRARTGGLRPQQLPALAAEKYCLLSIHAQPPLTRTRCCASVCFGPPADVTVTVTSFAGTLLEVPGTSQRTSRVFVARNVTVPGN